MKELKQLMITAFTGMLGQEVIHNNFGESEEFQALEHALIQKNEDFDEQLWNQYTHGDEDVTKEQEYRVQKWIDQAWNAIGAIGEVITNNLDRTIQLDKETEEEDDAVKFNPQDFVDKCITPHYDGEVSIQGVRHKNIHLVGGVTNDQKRAINAAMETYPNKDRVILDWICTGSDGDHWMYATIVYTAW